MAIIAAAIAPIMAMVGGGVDMGRSYLSQSRLQQACDAGVLAARKRLGADSIITGDIPEDAAEVGQRFFNINFRSGSYGTEGRDFVMTLEEDFAISGVATVDVPTTIMRVFGFNQVPVRVECEAQINFSNTDVMMVLDVTGSMSQTNPGDSVNRIDALKATVRSFYDQLAAAAQAGTRIRYGFVPYSTNVNVGALLKDDWVVDEWKYQSRKVKTEILTVRTHTYYTASTYISGTRSESTLETYAATFAEGSGYSCPTRPANAVTTSTTSTSSSISVLGPPAGVRTTTTYTRTRNGDTYWVTLSGSTCTVMKAHFVDYVDRYDKITEPALGSDSEWEYNQLDFDVDDWRTSGNGCIEERETYEITNYGNVKLDMALDLDLDLVPTAGKEKTQWRPSFPGLIYARALKWDGTGAFIKNKVSTSDDFVAPGVLGTAACPPAALKLTELSGGELDTYLDTLKAQGSTYHDIGMIWGGRLLSPTGIFSADNADVSGSSPTARHMIFLTDGETAPLDLSYGTYGLEPIDQRRWNPTSALSLTQTVEKRFSFACSEVRKKNITVWIIGFGTSLSDTMKNCAGNGRYFEAADAAELNATFAGIAKKLSELRIQR